MRSVLSFQFFRLCRGAGMRPPLWMKFSADSRWTGITGAEPRRPPISMVSPTVLPGAGRMRTAVVLPLTRPMAA